MFNDFDVKKVTIPHAAITVVIVKYTQKDDAYLGYNTARGNHSCNSRLRKHDFYWAYKGILANRKYVWYYFL